MIDEVTNHNKTEEATQIQVAENKIKAQPGWDEKCEGEAK